MPIRPYDDEHQGGFVGIAGSPSARDNRMGERQDDSIEQEERRNDEIQRERLARAIWSGELPLLRSVRRLPQALRDSVELSFRETSSVRLCSSGAGICPV